MNDNSGDTLIVGNTKIKTLNNEHDEVKCVKNEIFVNWTSIVKCIWIWR